MKTLLTVYCFVCASFVSAQLGLEDFTTTDLPAIEEDFTEPPSTDPPSPSARLDSRARILTDAEDGGLVFNRNPVVSPSVEFFEINRAAPATVPLPSNRILADDNVRPDNDWTPLAWPSTLKPTPTVSVQPLRSTRTRIVRPLPSVVAAPARASTAGISQLQRPPIVTFAPSDAFRTESVSVGIESNPTPAVRLEPTPVLQPQVPVSVTSTSAVLAGPIDLSSASFQPADNLNDSSNERTNQTVVSLVPTAPEQHNATSVTDIKLTSDTPSSTSSSNETSTNTLPASVTEAAAQLENRSSSLNETDEKLTQHFSTIAGFVESNTSTSPNTSAETVEPKLSSDKPTETEDSSVSPASLTTPTPVTKNPSLLESTTAPSLTANVTSADTVSELNTTTTTAQPLIPVTSTTADPVVKLDDEPNKLLGASHPSSTPQPDQVLTNSTSIAEESSLSHGGGQNSSQLLPRDDDVVGLDDFANTVDGEVPGTTVEPFANDIAELEAKEEEEKEENAVVTNSTTESTFVAPPTVSSTPAITTTDATAIESDNTTVTHSITTTTTPITNVVAHEGNSATTEPSTTTSTLLPTTASTLVNLTTTTTSLAPETTTASSGNTSEETLIRAENSTVNPISSVSVTETSSTSPSTLPTTKVHSTTVSTDEVASSPSTEGSISTTAQPASNSDVIIATTVSVVILLCVAVLLFLLVLYRRKRSRATQGTCQPARLDAYSLDNVSPSQTWQRGKIRSTLRASKRSYSNQAFDDPVAPSNLLTAAQLSLFMEKSMNGIENEFQQIPMPSSVHLEDLPQGIEIKNRYANVLPYPETRVRIRVLDSNAEDTEDNYINANYIRGIKEEPKCYIACQAPLDSTVGDFWQMVWETQSRVIIQLTDLTENGIARCAEYLPPSEVLDCHRLYGDFQITLKSRELRENYVVSHVQLKHMEDNLVREVRHLWYSAWPTTGVPEDVKTVISLLQEARKGLSKENSGPVVVHCSPGTGRTGTALAIDISMRQLDVARSIDIPRCVYKLRQDRSGCVQTKEQYIFIHKAVNHYASQLSNAALDSI